jgi:hypothetical protein
MTAVAAPLRRMTRAISPALRDAVNAVAVGVAKGAA